MSTEKPKSSFLERYGPRALILGGSEGIGASFADELAGMGFDLTLIARTQSRLEETAAKLRSRYGVDVAVEVLDLTRPGLAELAGALVTGNDYGLVVYNAGATHGVGLFLDQPVQRALDLVALNCIGSIAFAHHALAPMRARGRGGMIIISSMSGLAGAGYVATYAASKAFEITLCEGLHWEMARSGVDVMCAVATLTQTPAMERSGMLFDADPNYVPMDPATVARQALGHLGHTPVWFAAGEAAGETIRSGPHLAVSDQMSRTAAKMWGIEV